MQDAGDITELKRKIINNNLNQAKFSELFSSTPVKSEETRFFTREYVYPVSDNNLRYCLSEMQTFTHSSNDRRSMTQRLINSQFFGMFQRGCTHHIDTI